VERTNTVFVGRKPILNYVLACMTLFKSGQEEVQIKARGRAISRAVDVVEVLRNRYMPDLQISNIGIGTEYLESEYTNQTSNVSTIEISLNS
jgi:DNA-binding protein